jgi:hypothetical protein
MTAPTSLIDMILNLLRNPSAAAAFQQDPQSFLASCGAENVSPADVHDALVLAADDDQDWGRHGQHHGSVPPPPAPQPGETEHEAAVRYLNTYVNNTYVDARETNVDNSINQHIDTHGGDVDQTFDNHSVVASGDGSVAAGGNIDGSTVTTGNDNQVGEGNIKGDGNVVGDGNHVVSGSDNTTAFGTGAANSSSLDHVNVSDGGGLAVGGPASGTQNTTDSHNSATATTTTDTSYDHSFTTDNESTTGSDNHTDTHNSTDSHDTTHLDTLSHNTTDIHPVA